LLDIARNAITWISIRFLQEGTAAMSRHNKMPPIPPANRSPKGVGGSPELKKDVVTRKKIDNPAEEGETANIRQNTTNAGFFRGRRVK
jgi:hypothetical protein